MLFLLRCTSENFQSPLVLRPSGDFPNILIFSSLIFMTNCVTCFICKNTTHFTLFFLLTCSSVLVHYNDNIITNILDKIVIGFVFANGLYLFVMKKNKNIFVVLTFLFVLFCRIQTDQKRDMTVPA